MTGPVKVFSAICLLVVPVSAEVSRYQSIADSSGTVVKLFGAGLGHLDAYGSGTIISADGHVVTVWNHLINTSYLTAVTTDGLRYRLDVVGTSAAHDVAVLKLNTAESEQFPHINRVTTFKPDAGSQILAFSNMFQVAAGNEPVSVVHGIIAAEAKLEAGFGRWKFPLRSKVLILDAVTNNSGAAGGLLTDVKGTPVGLLGRELRHNDSGTWVNYAVPFETLNPVIDAILAGRSVDQNDKETAVLQISDRQLTSAWGMTLLPKVLRETPAYIDRVIPGSAADKAGLRRGDLVVLLNDDVIQTSTKLRNYLAQIRSGFRVTITVNRNGALQSVQMRVP